MSDSKKKLADLLKAGVNVRALAKDPKQLMSIANVGPETAKDIYKELGMKVPDSLIDKSYRDTKDKQKFAVKKPVAKTQIKAAEDEKVKLPLDILVKQKIPLEDVLGVFKVVLGTTGQGKSNTVAVIMEEYVEKKVPIHIIDIEGEHLSFAKEYDDFIILNKKKYADWKDNFKHKLKKVLKNRKNLIVDASTFNEEEKMEFLKEYFELIWDLEDRYRIPLSIFIEEVHTLIPQSGKTIVKPILRDYAKRGRKRKMEVTFITQRPQEADKAIITQAETAFLHKVSHPSNLAVYKVLIPKKEHFDTISTMKIGEVVYVNKGHCIRSMIRLRRTKHGASTMSVKDLNTKPKKVFGIFG